MTRARDFFERALALDPDTAQVDATLGAAQLTDDPVKTLAAAKVALTNALLQVPNSTIAHHFMGIVQLYTKRPIQAIAEFERALALNPNLANARANIGLAKLFDGRAEETEGDVNEALRLSPRDQRAWVWMVFLGSAKMQLGMDEDAVKWFRCGIELNPNLPVTHFFFLPPS
jgi:tetratricopeptide (TPR) repeat protein